MSAFNALDWRGMPEWLRKMTVMEVICTTIRHRERMGFSYPSGTLDKAIAVTDDLKSKNELVQAIWDVLETREVSAAPGKLLNLSKRD